MVKFVIKWLREMLTDKSKDVNFLTKLIRISCCNPLTISSGVRNITDTSEHETGGHDKAGKNNNHGPRPPVLQNWGNISENQKNRHGRYGKRDIASPVNGLFVRYRNRRVP